MIEVCEVCQHEGEDVIRSSEGVGMRSAMLCSFCISTLAGNTAVYPELYSSEMKFVATMAASLYWKLKAER